MAGTVEQSVPERANVGFVGFREIFEIRKVNSNPLRGHATNRCSSLPGLITSTLPFVLANGKSFVAIGCSEGIWVVDVQDPEFMHRLMDVKAVTEMAVIEEYSLLLVLADKALYCYSLDALDPYSDAMRMPQKLSGTASVDFFRVGVWASRRVVIYKKRNMTDSVFRILEPVLESPPATVTDPVVVKFDPDRVIWFRFQKDFYLPVDCTDLVFLKSAVAVLHALGFEILDLQTLSTITVPRQEDPHSKALAKRCKAGKALGIFWGKEGKHLLCYNTFGLFVDQHGEPLHDLHHVIEWRGTVYAVASVPPYVVLFKAQSIEVRRGDSGRLEQVIFGNGIRCSWRGPGMLQEGLEEDDPMPNLTHTRSRMQIVMHAPHGMGSNEVAQHVYDLVFKETSVKGTS